MFSDQQWLANSGSGFYNGVATQSLRFEDGSSTYLTKTFGSDGTGSGATCTISCWVKRANISNNDQWFFTAGASSPAWLLGFRTADTLLFGDDDGNPTVTVTNRLFRDTSAWYHIVLTIKTSESDNANKYKIYVNGELQATTFSGTAADTLFGANVVHNIGRYPTGSTYVDLYMSELNFVDGLALDASYFGETKNGVWIAKEPDVSEYGTNGFRLKFDQVGVGTASTSTIGADTSGKTNHFTSSGIVASDCNMPDSPENNFCTLNPRDDDGHTNAEGNLKVSGNVIYGHEKSTFAVTSGKWYFEGKLSTQQNDTGIGLANQNASTLTHYLGQTADSVGYLSDGRFFYNGSSTSYTSWTTTDVGQIAFNADTGEIWIGKNNTWQNSGNPANGTGEVRTVTWNEFIVGARTVGSGAIVFNFGQDGSFAGGLTGDAIGDATDGNKNGLFKYAPPSGFLALCTANLPEPTISPNADTQADDHFNTILWTGNATARTISGVGFAPSWVWLKSRTRTDWHNLFDTSRGANDRLVTNNTNAEETTSGHLTAFTSDGFVIGTNSNVNRASNNYVAWNWKAGGATPKREYRVVVVSDGGNKYRFRNSANSATFGASAVTLDLQEGGTYTFDQSDSTNSNHPFRFSTTSNGTHGGGSAYTTGVTVVGTAGQAGAYTQIVVANSAPQLYYYCTNHSNMGGQANTNTTHGSTNFDGSILSVPQVNTESGFSIVKYVGTGSAVTVGHSLGTVPSMFIVKRRNATSGWATYHKDLTNATQYIQINSTGGQTTGNNVWNQTDPTSSVFTVGTDLSVSSGTYVAYCFAEIEGYSKFGRYTGSSAVVGKGTFVYLGFRPSFVILKDIGGGEWGIFDSARNTFNVVNKRISAESSGAEFSGDTNRDMDFLSNGFKLMNAYPNGLIFDNSARSYIYMAFAENPFKYANAR